MLQQVFGWLDDEYDKIPVEREILADNELPGTVLRLRADGTLDRRFGRPIMALPHIRTVSACRLALASLSLLLSSCLPLRRS